MYTRMHVLLGFGVGTMDRKSRMGITFGDRLGVVRCLYRMVGKAVVANFLDTSRLSISYYLDDALFSSGKFAME